MFVSNTSALTGVQAGDNFPAPETDVWFFDPLLAQRHVSAVLQAN